MDVKASFNWNSVAMAATFLVLTFVDISIKLRNIYWFIKINIQNILTKFNNPLRIQFLKNKI